MSHASTKVRSGAGIAVGALAAAALVLVPSAQAATTVNVTNADVKPVENDSTYTSWHQGYASSETKAKVTAKGLELTGPSQVIKGYTDNSSTIGENKNFDLTAKITSSDFTTTSGVASLQVPLFAENVVPNEGSTSKFATLRSLSDDGSRIKLTDEWESSRAIGDIPANTPTPLKTLIPALGDYKVVAFGVQAQQNAIVTDITWDGTTYTFKDPVTKAKGKVDIYRVNPVSGKITPRSTVSVYATITVDGKSAKAGTTVYGYAKGKKVVTGKVNSQGKVKLVLPVKLPYGKATLKVQQVGSSALNGDTDSIVVRVKK